MTKFALVQATAPQDLRAGLDTVARFARQAAAAGCAAICFPECFLTGYRPTDAQKLAIHRSRLDPLRDLAAELRIDLLVGYMEREGDLLYITHSLLRPDGTGDHYRKTHLGKQESEIFTPGDCLPVFSLTCGWQVGFQICVENHYPEIAQTLALKGCEAIFAPHASVRASGDREKIWSKYIPARSYDARVYMLCCNLWDEHRFAGGCLITDPNGEPVASCFTDGESLLIADLDRTKIAHYRTRNGTPSRHFFPSTRRPALYHP